MLYLKFYIHSIPSLIVIGGDLNLDFSRSCPSTYILSDYITDFSYYKYIDFSNTSVTYNWIIGS